MLVLVEKFYVYLKYGRFVVKDEGNGYWWIISSFCFNLIDEFSIVLRLLSYLICYEFFFMEVS